MKFITTISVLFLHMSVYTQIHAEHEPWQLENANARIDSIRKGTTDLNFTFANGKKLPSNAKLNLELQSHDFKFGVSMTQARGFFGTDAFQPYLEATKSLFNFATVGFYWYLTDERRNKKQKQKIDDALNTVIDWGVQNNIALKGHPLLWHESNPDWVVNMEDMTKMDTLINKKISRLINTYPEIDYWDVYNEPVAPFKNHVKPNGVSKWVKFKGGIYPAMAYLYNYVEKINSNKIYVNNHYNPSDPAFHELNKQMTDNDIPYQAIGMQAHMQTFDGIFSESELWDLLESFSVYDKEIQFTELSITSSPKFNNWKDHQVFLDKRDKANKKGRKLNLETSIEGEFYQAAYLKDFYTLVFSHPKVSAITMWNLTDRNAWRGHAAGILRSDFSPKPAFETLKKLIKETWSTEVDTIINPKKPFQLIGFYGHYEGTLTLKNGEVYPISFDHLKAQKLIEVKID